MSDSTNIYRPAFAGQVREKDTETNFGLRGGGKNIRSLATLISKFPRSDAYGYSLLSMMVIELIMPCMNNPLLAGMSYQSISTNITIQGHVQDLNFIKSLDLVHP